MTELSRADVPVPVLIEHFESLLDLLLAVRIAHFARHHREKLREIQRPVPISVQFIDHVLELSLSRVLPQRSHHGPELLGGDRAIAICIRETEAREGWGDGIKLHGTYGNDTNLCRIVRKPL